MLMAFYRQPPASRSTRHRSDLDADLAEDQDRTDLALSELGIFHDRF